MEYKDMVDLIKVYDAYQALSEHLQSIVGCRTDEGLIGQIGNIEDVIARNVTNSNLLDRGKLLSVLKCD